MKNFIKICTLILTMFCLVLLTDTNDKVTTHLNSKQTEIDSLQHEIDFRDDMILKFIENNETDPIGVRVEVKKEGR